MNGKNSMDNTDLAAEVKSTQGNYRIIVGNNILQKIPSEIQKFTSNKNIFIIADKVLFPLQVLNVSEILESNGYTTNVLTVDFSEANKNLDTVNYIYKWLSKLLAERNNLIISFGGGVTGDLVGFVASTWLRGIPYIQIPTTLASMVDASIGGKVGVNLSEGKNLIGSFYHPKLVFQDLSFLSSLPDREYNSGWAEIIKHGLIKDKKLLGEIEIFSNKSNHLIEIIKKSVEVKNSVISEDEFEKANRIILNYGHTIGHALEKITEYKKYLHGEAVSIGMMIAAKISQELGMLDSKIIDRQKKILLKFNLPIYHDIDNPQEIIKATKIDKKTSEGKVKWILLKDIGKVVIKSDIDDSLITKAILDFYKKN
tara:strand:- start:16911 stop:18017 length:1107 start_codon:yes stop_codon:yes gene_type:complete